MSTGRKNRREFLGAGVAAAALGPAAPSPASADLPPSAASKLQLGLVTYNLAAAWDLPTLLRVADAVGIAAVELRTTHRHGVEPTLSAMERKEVRNRFAESRTQLWGLGTTCEFHSPDAAAVETQIETCKRFLQLCADLGGAGVKVRPNGLPKDVPTERTLEQIGKAAARCGAAAKDLGLEVWIEVHGPGTCQPSRMKAIMEACGHPSVGLTWNSNREDVKDGSVREAFALLRPWIKSCHINELYSGYPYRELFGLLNSVGYGRCTLIEIPQKLEPAPGELLLRYYKALWEELSRG